MHRQGRRTQAEKYLLEGYDGIDNKSGADQATKQRARERLAKFYVDTNQRDKLNALNLVAGHDATAAAARPN